MTLEEVRERVEAIRDAAGYDYEKAHSLEDDLRRDVLLAIAAGTPYCRRLAVEALRTADITFDRHAA